MNKILISNKFKRQYKKIVKKNPNLQSPIDKSILLLEENIFHPKLKTHILYDNLSGFHACSCGYDCRILFKIFSEKNPTELLLLDIGTHDVVY